MGGEDQIAEEIQEVIAKDEQQPPPPLLPSFSCEEIQVGAEMEGP